MTVVMNPGGWLSLHLDTDPGEQDQTYYEYSSNITFSDGVYIEWTYTDQGDKCFVGFCNDNWTPGGDDFTDTADSGAFIFSDATYLKWRSNDYTTNITPAATLPSPGDTVRFLIGLNDDSKWAIWYGLNNMWFDYRAWNHDDTDDMKTYLMPDGDVRDGSYMPMSDYNRVALGVSRVGGGPINCTYKFSAADQTYSVPVASDWDWDNPPDTFQPLDVGASVPSLPFNRVTRTPVVQHNINILKGVV